MKVWISLCLIWLMVRVVSAQPVLTAVPNGTDESSFDFSRIKEALSKVERVATEDDGREHSEVLKLLRKFSSLEELMRGSLVLSWSPLRDMGWSLPAPEVDLSPKDEMVFRAMATRYLYPEVRLVEGISEVINDLVSENGFLIGRRTRLSAQKVCLEAKTLNKECVIKEGLKSVSQLISEKVAQEYDSVIPAEALAIELNELIVKGGSQSALYESAFLRDASSEFLESLSLYNKVMMCISYPTSFFAWQLIGQKRCELAFDTYVNNLAKSAFSLDAEVQQMVKKELFNPFSDFQIIMVSLSEEVLNRGVFCYSHSCVERKISERLQEWSYADRFSVAQRNAMAKTLAKFWLE